MLGGTLLAGASKLTGTLSRPGMLNHEAYMALYSYSVCAFVLPLLIYSSHSNHQKNSSSIEKTIIFTIIFGIISFKTLILDRIMMQRFADEYDEKKHTLPNLFGKWLDQDPLLEQDQAQEDNEIAPENEQQAEEE